VSMTWISAAEVKRLFDMDQHWLDAMCTNGRVHGWHRPPSVIPDRAGGGALYCQEDIETVLAELVEHALNEEERLKREARHLTKSALFGQMYGMPLKRAAQSMAAAGRQLSADFSALEVRMLAALKAGKL